MDLDPDKLEAFFEASEEWNSAMNMSNSMAFISQFGVGSHLLCIDCLTRLPHHVCFVLANPEKEYNPGGGKDEVLKYLNESQKQVVIAKKALETIMKSLDISV
jgi:hypothetical protein